MRIPLPFGFGVLAMATAIAVGACRPADDGMSPIPSRKTFLDPYTVLFQTDDDREGRKLASEPGYWPVPNGQRDPLAKKPKARVLHCVYRRSETPWPDYDPTQPSPVFKVNQVGYMPSQPKFAYMGAWLGPVFGAWRPHAPLRGWELVDAMSGKTVLRRVGDNAPSHRVDDATTKDGTPFTGEFTYEMDFSSVTNEGTYFVRVEGVGRSENFRIWNGAAEEAFRVHMGGLYQKRCGIAKTEPYTHWTAGACHTNVVRGSFAPEEGTTPTGRTASGSPSPAAGTTLPTTTGVRRTFRW